MEQKKETEEKTEEKNKQKQDDTLIQRVIIAAKVREEARKEHEENNKAQKKFINTEEQKKSEDNQESEDLERRAQEAEKQEQLASVISLYDLAKTNMYETLHGIEERATYGRLSAADEEKLAFYTQQLADRDSSYIQNPDIKLVIEKAEQMLERINQYNRGQTDTKETKRRIKNV